MDDILEILSDNARVTPEEIARMTRKKVSEIKRKIKQYEDDGTIIKYKTVVDPQKVFGDKQFIRALIQVSITPQKDVGFDNVAERIYSFPEVTSCSLVSGDYDLLVIVEGDNLQTVSDFVASKLSPMEGIRGTSTHFLLKKYKEDGQILKKLNHRKRLAISI